MDLTFNCPDTVLMMGNESEHMTTAQIVSAARFAAKIGFRAITFKVADGNIRYKTTQQVEDIIAEINSVGMGAMPFVYVYGPRFGDNQIKIEAAFIKELADDASDTVVVDMEAEWNNNPRACGLFRDELKTFIDSKHSMIISTWADPVQQGWTKNIVELNPLVERNGAWGPQQYSLWLAQQEQQLHDAKGDIFPEVNMMVSPLEVAKQASLRRHKSLWVWYYHSVESMQLLAKSVVSTFVKGEETHLIPAVPKPVIAIPPTPVTTPPLVSEPVASGEVPQEDSWLNTAINDTEQVLTDLAENPQVQSDVVDTAEALLSALATGNVGSFFTVQEVSSIENLAYTVGQEVEKVLENNPGLKEPVQPGTLVKV